MDQETDSLTRLPGRAALLRRMDDEIARAGRYGVPLALLLLGIDGFAALAAARGREASEDVLCRVALALLSSAREGDTAARAGEDKFALLLPDTDGTGALARAERLEADLNALDMGEEGAPLRVTVRIGVAAFEPGLAEGAALMTHAEEALRRVKCGAGVETGV